MQDTDWAYIAGIIDADGSMGIYSYKKTYSYQLQMFGDSQLMEWLGNRLDNSRIFTIKGTWVWVTRNREVVTYILSNAIPYMVTKQAEAKTMLEYFDKYPIYSIDDGGKEYYSRTLKSIKHTRHLASGGCLAQRTALPARGEV